MHSIRSCVPAIKPECLQKSEKVIPPQGRNVTLMASSLYQPGFHNALKLSVFVPRNKTKPKKNIITSDISGWCPGKKRSRLIHSCHCPSCLLPERRSTSFTAKVASTPAVFVFITKNINATSLPTGLLYVVKNEIPSQFRQSTDTKNTNKLSLKTWRG